MTNFSFKCVENTSSVKIKLIKVGQPYQKTFRYSKNMYPFQDYTLGEEILLEPGEQLRFKCNGTKQLSKNIQNRYQFITSGDGDLLLGGDLLEIASDVIRPVYDYEFNGLFEGCKNIVGFNNDFRLPASTAKFSYANLFKDCSRLSSSIVSAGYLLEARDLAPWCYSGMFNSCTSLVDPPQLPATGLAKYCYDGMFMNCSSLSTAPVLSAATLAPFCYCSMFNMCSNLTEAPYLSAATLVEGCYKNMFMDCKSLSSIRANISQWNENYTGNWVKGVNVNGIFEYFPNTPIERGYSKIPQKWRINDLNNSLTFLASKGPASISFNWEDDGYNTQYKLNDQSWSAYTKATVIDLASGDTVSFKSNFNQQTASYEPRFYITGLVEAYGNVQSLVNFSNTAGYFAHLFHGCSGLLTPPQLPATTLVDSCYQSMFNGCTSLTAAPQLPATTVGGGCYQAMFKGCTSLIEAPQLPATELGNWCYYQMFGACSSLSTAPELPATTLAVACYKEMFSNCTALTAAPILSATTLANSCYQKMFSNCTSLTAAPQLPATTLIDECYDGIFQNCSNLSSIEVNFTSWNFNATRDWLNGVATEGIFIKPQQLPEQRNVSYYTFYIPVNWTVQNK